MHQQRLQLKRIYPEFRSMKFHNPEIRMSRLARLAELV